MGNRKYHKNTADAGTTKYFDYSLLFIIIFLVLFGLVMLYSVSAYEGQDVFNDPFHYMNDRQAAHFWIHRYVYRQCDSMRMVEKAEFSELCAVISDVCGGYCSRKRFERFYPLAEDRTDSVAAV